MSKTIRIIGSKLTIELPLWVRKTIKVGPTHKLSFTPINGMIRINAGDAYDIVDYSGYADSVHIPERSLTAIGLNAYDLVELVQMGDEVYIAKYCRENPTCQMCERVASTADFNGIHMCNECLDEMLDCVIGLEG